MSHITFEFIREVGWEDYLRTREFSCMIMNPGTGRIESGEGGIMDGR